MFIFSEDEKFECGAKGECDRDIFFGSSEFLGELGGQVRVVRYSHEASFARFVREIQGKDCTPRNAMCCTQLLQKDRAPIRQSTGKGYQT